MIMESSFGRIDYENKVSLWHGVNEDLEEEKKSKQKM